MKTYTIGPIDEAKIDEYTPAAAVKRQRQATTSAATATDTANGGGDRVFYYYDFDSEEWVEMVLCGVYAGAAALLQPRRCLAATDGKTIDIVSTAFNSYRMVCDSVDEATPTPSRERRDAAVSLATVGTILEVTYRPRTRTAAKAVTVRGLVEAVDKHIPEVVTVAEWPSGDRVLGTFHVDSTLLSPLGTNLPLLSEEQRTDMMRQVAENKAALSMANKDAGETFNKLWQQYAAPCALVGKTVGGYDFTTTESSGAKNVRDWRAWYRAIDRKDVDTLVLPDDYAGSESGSKFSEGARRCLVAAHEYEANKQPTTTNDKGDKTRPPPPPPPPLVVYARTTLVPTKDATHMLTFELDGAADITLHTPDGLPLHAPPVLLTKRMTMPGGVTDVPIATSEWRPNGGDAGGHYAFPAFTLDNPLWLPPLGAAYYLAFDAQDHDSATGRAPTLKFAHTTITFARNCDRLALQCPLFMLVFPDGGGRPESRAVYISGNMQLPSEPANPTSS